jgi:hypothetical protein
MGWIKKIIYISATLVAAVMFFDLTIFFIFPEIGKKLKPIYGAPNVQIDLPDDFRRGHPRYYFQSHPERGFDITPGIKAMARKPEEAPAYPVWGNSLGCFDTEHEPDAIRKGYVYLAGDSFTWGYAPLESKFGTLLEKFIKRPVLKCGVSNSGQMHQLNKFLEITNKVGRLPEVVIVNVFKNDICDDFAFPYSVVIDGYMVGDAFVKYDGMGKPHIIRKSLGELKEKFRLQNKVEIIRRNRVEKFKTFIKRYSATALIINGVYEKFIEGGVFVDEVKTQVPCSREPLYPFEKSFAAKNKEVIEKWITHSLRNRYKLYFSLIPSRTSESEYYSKLKKFLKSKQASFIDFQLYIEKNKLDKKSLYWKLDGHFNVRGNLIYSEFLRNSIFRP